VTNKPKLRVLDLFSGIGGFSLGLERTGGFETVAFCEIEPFPRAVLAKHWPEVPCYEDVRTLTAERLAADGISVDVLCGGFPCQDLSLAGRLAGMDGTRSGLWSEVARLVGELRPRYAILENVANLLSGPSGRPGGWFARVLGDLAEIRYDAEWHCIPAGNLGTPHERDRVWAVAYPHGSQCEGRGLSGRIHQEYTNARRSSWWEDQPVIQRTANGVPSQSHRLKALGNAVVPQIPEMIGRAILQAEGWGEA
jgi:DNA (cytosine-5)-methyltransferase 1